ncbi:MAG: cysteine desulfurase [Gemmatimonadetes bacterium]|nr:cysteine desulfurase [Gemmatimonadota bacterium]
MSATTMVSLDPTALRARFPLLARHSEPPLAYLDNAATTQKPDAVIDAVAGFYREDNANVHRGLYELARRATERYEGARETVARFIHANEPAEVVWVRGTTEAINLVATAWGNEHVGPGDEIVISVLEHHSNFVPWQLLAKRTGARLRHIDIDEEGRLRMDQLRSLLSRRTKIVAVGHVSNALGTIHPIRAIADLAHDAGAIVVIDGAQAAPHLPIDVRALDCDFYALSGHKMLGPMGVGALWGRRELLEAMQPYHGGGEMIDIVELDRSTWAEVPHKFEAGTPNGGGAVGMAAAVEFLNILGHEALWAHERELIRYGLARLSEVDGLRLFGPTTEEQRISVFSFALEGIHPHDIATVLDAENVAVRAGHHCAQPLMHRLGVPATTRASLYLYNTTDEIDRLVDGLESAKRLFR